MVDKNPRVYLDIEDNLIPCDKADLIRHSDYFKVMFEGDFLERHKTTVKIQEVEFKAMTIILTLLWDENYVIDNADILSVLQTACMLQFDKIRRLCVERVTEMLSPDNCVDVWFTTEALGLRPLCLKAKSMALMEFALTKDMECMLELNLSQLYAYLSDVKLRCANEMDVFDTCMKWWYHNVSYLEAKNDEEDVFTKILLRFLCCIDFKSVPVSDVKEMMGYPDVSNNEEIVKILEAVVQIRDNVVTDVRMDVAAKARLLAGCRSRAVIQFFCIVVDDSRDICKRTKLSSEVYTESVGGRSKCAKNVLLYDDRKGRFVKLFSVPQEKHANLEGFHLLGYKEFVFFFGGEISLGRGNWNTNFWVYDTIRERWERKSKLPYGRRHFESCIAGNILYIVGGTGSYRVIQDNMFYYNYRDNIWSKQITLPCVSRQIKCCDYNGQLFLLNVNGKCGYLFDLSATNWWQMDICDTNDLVTIYPEKFSLFSYRNRLYVKGLDMTYVALVSFTSAHLKISQGAFRSVRRTCLKRLNLRQGESPCENRRELDDEMQEEIAKCVRHLQSLFTLCRMLEDIYTYLILLQIVISLVVLCTCLFLVSSIPLGVQLFGNELAYLLAIENQLAVYCFAGNKITAGGEGIPLAVYECDWFAASESFKRCMLFTMMRMRRPIYLTIGKFSPLTLSTFVTIGRRSYSLLAVLKNRG